ncbi:Uncharacterised protein r2_g2912 [Pycnogonum litorale]
MITLQVLIEFCVFQRYKSKSSQETAPEVTKYEPKLPRIEWIAESLAARGFSRAAKSYTPPDDLNDTLQQITVDVFGEQISKDWLKSPLSNGRIKFKLLTRCEKKYDHPIPNAVLYSLSSVRDVLEYYETPVSSSTPYQDLQKRKDLPPNLHIQPRALRFHPDTDTFFDGVTAYPENTTIVSSIKYKRIYEGYKHSRKWPHNLHEK